MDWAIDGQILLRVGVAAILGGVIGLERELANKPAGLRTHMIVAATCALLVGLMDLLVQHYHSVAYGNDIRPDPSRVIQAVVMGISFLGAGTIIRHPADKHVEGLTTASSILMVTAIGLAAGLGQYLIAISVTILLLVILVGLRYAERYLATFKKERQRQRP